MSRPTARLPIAYRPLPYEQRLEPREPGSIELVVIHCTELPDLKSARAYGETVHYPSSETGNSGHYYVDRDGRLEQWVDCARIAHHVRGFNERSVGIELVNTGRYPDWLDSGQQTMTEPYPQAQIDALIELLNLLRAELPALRTIAGHDTLDTDTVPASDDPTLVVRRKCDPGPLFPWPRVLAAVPLSPFLP